MSKLWSTVLVAIVASVVGVGTAFAADPPKDGEKKERKRPSAEQIFKRLDTDKDGKLTVAELTKSKRIDSEDKAKAVIAKWDTDKNGSVSLKEFTAALKKRHGDHGHDHKKGDHKKGDHKKGDHKKGDDKK